MKKRYLLKIILALIIILTYSLILGCDNNEKSISTEQWIEDIDYLADELPKRHIDFYSITDEEKFNRQLEELKQNVPKLNDDEIEVELGKILASIGVAHTRLDYNIEYYYPIELYWFEEGIYLINTTEEYKKALNSKLIKINGNEINEIVDSVSSVISTENDAWLRYLVPKYMMYSDILYGLGITDKKEYATFTFENLKGEVFDIKINSINVTSIKDSNGSEYIVDSDENLRYLSNKSNGYYWYVYLPEEQIIYFQYNQCIDMEEIPFSEFNEELFAFIDNNSVDKLIVDLRNNSGGNSSVFKPFLDKITQYDNLNTKESLYVLVGRQTFSSGVLNAVELSSYTNTTFIGEQMGGETNLYGEIDSFKLKNSGISIFYSTKKFESIYRIANLIPIIDVEYTFEDYINGIDPALELIYR